MADRWATFDCYGTLVDWNSGIRSELARLISDPDADLLLGLPSIWINRRGETGDPAPTRELPTLTGLADTLDELVPA